MPAVLDAAKAVGTIHAVEKAGTNDDAQSKELISDITKHAQVLLTNSLTDMANRTDAIYNAANAVQKPSPLPRRFRDRQAHLRNRHAPQRGLSGNDTQALRSIEQTCSQIASAASDLGIAMGNPDSFKDIANNADGLRQKAAAVLSAEAGRGP